MRRILASLLSVAALIAAAAPGAPAQIGPSTAAGSRVAKAYDTDMSFMLLEVAGDELHFQCINRLGETVDSGVVTHQRPKSAPSN
ncbi:MAG TPA: hypothetical protein VD861_14255 [Pyrinomonadaceae bacterium]|nr:hypothetical protein [Pyrinomonadaceae bacterium]